MSENSVKPSKKADIVKVVLAIVAVILTTYMFVDPGDQKFQADLAMVRKIDSLDSVNKNLVMVNQELDSIVEEYNQRIIDLDWKLTNLMNNREAERDRYRDISNDASDDSPSEVDSFFMNRYQY